MTKSDASKYMEDDRASYVDVSLQNPSIPEVDVMSSDDETISSSIMPIPETLRQMRCNLKKTISDMGEHTEVESVYTEEESVPKEATAKVMSNSLEELRKKYMLKNEMSVNLKMNSANLMLDAILKNNGNLKENFQRKFLKIEENKKKKVGDTETSSLDESVCSVKQCDHAALLPSSGQKGIPYDFTIPFCPKHYKSFEPFYISPEKVVPMSNEAREDSKKKVSLVERLHAFPVEKIHSVYKVMQNYYKTRKKHTPIEKEIPSKEQLQNPDIIREEERIGYENKEYFPGEFHQRQMVFDLLENNGVYQKFNRNVERQEIVMDGNEKYSCQDVKDQCTCGKCTCSATRAFSPNCPDQKIAFQALKSENYQEEAVITPVPPESRGGFKGGKKHCYKERKLFERTDIYYFDHGNSAYYRTTDTHPMRYTECLVERTDEYATKFWAEFFGVIEVGIAFLISFILQFYRFCFTSIIRSLTVGLLQIFSDYFFKPLLTITFNGLIQPLLILGYNIATSFRDLCLPISETFGFYVKEVANLFRACRLVEVNRDCCRQPPSNCENKV